MLNPNLSPYNPDPAYLRSLIAQTGMKNNDLAMFLNIQPRMLRSFISQPTAKTYQRCPYWCQLVLELAAGH